MMEILIVDDERVLREGLKNLLMGEGYAVRTARGGDEALEKIAERRPDLVLLDVMMPKLNGFRCCDEIRKSDALLPIVFLTAKDSEADQVRGLGLGADDYISKDAGEQVLLARIARALARAGTMAASTARRAEDAVRMGRVSVDRTSFVVSIDGKKVTRLTRSEADIFDLLYRNRPRTFTIDGIVSALRGEGFACEDTLVYSHVWNLRRKLGPAAEMIACTRGIGYRFVG